MESQEVNDGIARVMGLKSPKVTFVRVSENSVTKEVVITIQAYATKGQVTRIKALLVKYLGGKE